eukprot:10415054-Alexandrium_andersonii.AAC.1
MPCGGTGARAGAPAKWALALCESGVANRVVVISCVAGVMGHVLYVWAAVQCSRPSVGVTCAVALGYGGGMGVVDVVGVGVRVS